MKKVVFFTGSYGWNSAKFLADVLQKFGYEAIVTEKQEDIFRGTDLVVIDEDSTTEGVGPKLHEFLKKHPVIPHILCGCEGCKEKEYLWKTQNREILKRIFEHLGEEKMAKLLS